MAFYSVKQWLKYVTGFKDEHHNTTDSPHNMINNLQKKLLAEHCKSNNATALEKLFMSVEVILDQ